MPKSRMTFVFLALTGLFPTGFCAQQSPGKNATAYKLICTLQPAPKIIKRANPVIPAYVTPKALAEGVAARIEIDKQGVPTEIHVIKGDPALSILTVAALRQWRWKPYKLNGEAVEVETTITINFEPARD